jgi:hypothetical protein
MSQGAAPHTMASIAEPPATKHREPAMHPYLTDHIVRDHHATLEREAHRQRLANAASAAARAHRTAPAMARFMPHVGERGRLRRTIASLLGPTPA